MILNIQPDDEFRRSKNPKNSSYSNAASSSNNLEGGGHGGTSTKEQATSMVKFQFLSLLLRMAFNVIESICSSTDERNKLSFIESERRKMNLSENICYVFFCIESIMIQESMCPTSNEHNPVAEVLISSIADIMLALRSDKLLHSTSTTLPLVLVQSCVDDFINLLCSLGIQ